MDTYSKHFPKVMALSIHYIQISLYFSVRKCKSKNEGKSVLKNKTEKHGKKVFLIRRKKKRKGNVAFIFKGSGSP